MTGRVYSLGAESTGFCNGPSKAVHATREAALTVGYVGYWTIGPIATNAVYRTAPYSKAISDFAYGFFNETGFPEGWGYLSSGGIILYKLIEHYFAADASNDCGKNK